MITLADLQFMEALARTGSLSGAARTLNVTPPALSLRLKKLERTLGVSLVVRSSRRLRFTGEGEHLVSEAQAMLARNVYGWFERISKGVYALTPAGHDALRAWADHLPGSGTHGLSGADGRDCP